MKIQSGLKWYLILLAIRALSVPLRRGKYRQRSQCLRTPWEYWLQVLLEWDTGASSKIESHTSLRYLVSWLVIGATVFLNWGLLFVTRVINLSCLLIRQPRWTRQLHWAATEQRLSSWEMERRSCSVSTMKMWGGKYVFIKKWKYKFRFFCDVPGKGNSGFVVVLMKKCHKQTFWLTTWNKYI